MAVSSAGFGAATAFAATSQLPFARSLAVSSLKSSEQPQTRFTPPPSPRQHAPPALRSAKPSASLPLFGAQGNSASARSRARAHIRPDPQGGKLRLVPPSASTQCADLADRLESNRRKHQANSSRHVSCFDQQTWCLQDRRAEPWARDIDAR